MTGYTRVFTAHLSRSEARRPGGGHPAGFARKRGLEGMWRIDESLRSPYRSAPSHRDILRCGSEDKRVLLHAREEDDGQYEACLDIRLAEQYAHVW